jgi:CBS domain-containing protein
MENGQSALIDVVEQMCTQQDVGLEAMRVARDIMNTEVGTLTLDDRVSRCLKVMDSRKVRHVPVMDVPDEDDKKPRFVGIVSQRDVLRLNAPDGKESSKQEVDQRALRQLLTQIVARRPKSVSIETPVEDVITTMTSNHIDMVPVLDDGDLVGIITTADLMGLFLRLDKAIEQLCPESKEAAASVDMAREDSAKCKLLLSWVHRAVQEIMTEPAICLGPKDNVAGAIELLQSEEFRHVPITDEQGKFVGLVSDRDILRNLPFAGRRPPSAPKRFREHLFATHSRTKSLQLPLERIMVQKVSHILPGSRVTDAAHTLYKDRISCLPVVDEQEKLRGMITITDLMWALAAAYEPGDSKPIEAKGISSAT